MSNIIQIVCDSEQEANFSVEICKAKNYLNIKKAKFEKIEVIEVEGSFPEYKFTSKLKKSAQDLWMVTAEN